MGVHLSGREKLGRLVKMKPNTVFAENLLQSTHELRLAEQKLPVAYTQCWTVLDWPNQGPYLNLIEYQQRDMRMAVDTCLLSTLLELEKLCQGEWDSTIKCTKTEKV